jgi:TolA-binding protein
MSNRVEDLERQVAELQAAVNGLTEELVEMKERVRQVEDAQEVAVDAEAAAAAEESPSDASDAPTPTEGERRTHSDDHVEVVERTGGPSSPGEAAGSEPERADVDSPAADDGEPAPETTGDGEGGDAEDGESDDSDIIVA